MSNIVEIWKDIKGYDGIYQVSDKGNVKSLGRYIEVVDKAQKRIYTKLIRERIIKQFYDNHGYKTVSLRNRGETKRFRVHALVANAFIEKNESNKNLCVNHKDGNKANNDICNLEWCTYKENSRHAIDNELLSRSTILKTAEKNKIPVDMLTLDGRYIKTFDGISDAYRYFGKKYSGGIVSVCKGDRNKCLGYKWRYNAKSK